MDDRFDDFESEQTRNKKRKVEYTCNQCEYVATRAGNLKTHIENKHEVVRNPSSKCKFAATTAGSLKVHI